MSAKKYVIKVGGKVLATFEDYATWDEAQDALKCARKDCGVSWSNSVNCETWEIDYSHPCNRDGYLITYYKARESIRAKIQAA